MRRFRTYLISAHTNLLNRMIQNTSLSFVNWVDAPVKKIQVLASTRRNLIEGWCMIAILLVAIRLRLGTRTRDFLVGHGAGGPGVKRRGLEESIQSGGNLLASSSAWHQNHIHILTALLGTAACQVLEIVCLLPTEWRWQAASDISYGVQVTLLFHFRLSAPNRTASTLLHLCR